MAGKINLTPVRFTYSEDGDENANQILLCGSFDDWERQIVMNKVHGHGGGYIHEMYLSLNPGERYEYKYKVDGEWKHSNSANEPTVLDDHGRSEFNNVIEVPADGVEAGLYYDVASHRMKVGTPVAQRTRSKINKPKKTVTGTEGVLDEPGAHPIDSEVDYATQSEDSENISAPDPLLSVLATTAAPSKLTNSQIVNSKCARYFAVQMEVSIHDRSIEIKMKADTSTLDAYLHLQGAEGNLSKASLLSIATEVFGEYDALGVSLTSTSEACCLFSVVFLSDDILESFVERLKDIEKILSEKLLEKVFLQPKTQQLSDLNIQCQLGVHLVEKTQKNKDVYPTEMKRVTPQNLSNFKSTWPCNTATEASLRDLQTELITVVSWFDLGVQLNIQHQLLQEIEQDYGKTKGRRLGMLMQWSQLETPTWGKVVRALINIDEISLAKKIAKKHGIPFPVLKLEPQVSTGANQSDDKEFEHTKLVIENQAKELYQTGAKVMDLTEQKNNLLKLLNMSMKARERNDEEVALYEKQLKMMEEELADAKHHFINLCREMLVQLKRLVSKIDLSSPPEENVGRAHSMYGAIDIRNKRLEIQHLKEKIKKNSGRIRKQQDDIQSGVTQLEDNITTMSDEVYNKTAKRLTRLLETTVPMKEELRILIQEKQVAEMELKRLKESSLHEDAKKLLSSCHGTMESLHQEIGNMNAKKEIANLCKNYTFEVEVPHLNVVKISGSYTFANVCMNCRHTCHVPCGVTTSGSEFLTCMAFDDSNGKCKICPGRCHYSTHRTTADSMYEVTTSKEKRTIEGLEEIYKRADTELSTMKQKVSSYKKQLEDNLRKLHQMFAKKKPSEAEIIKEMDSIADAIEKAQNALRS